MIRVVVSLALTLAVASPAGAQDPQSASGTAQDTAQVDRVRERALEKLRALEAASRLPEPVDSTEAEAAADSVADAEVVDSVADVAVADSVTGGVAADSVTEAIVIDSVAGAVVADSMPSGVAATDTAIAAAAEPEAEPGRLDSPMKGVREPPVIVHMPPDSFMAALRDMEGYALTEYRAAGATFDADTGRLSLYGEPSLDRDGQGMEADSLLVYDQTSAIICGYGSPVLQGMTGDPVESEQVCYNVESQEGVAFGARTQFTQGGSWIVHGEELHTAGDERVYGSHTAFTSCDLDVPHYHFAAKDMKIVHDEILVARDVTLNFADVPVFWLPFMVQSLKDGRRSGLLTPSFGVNDIVRNSTGYRRRLQNLGFYWAINDYFGAQASMDWESQNYVGLSGQLQYNWRRQFLNGSLMLTQYWREEGGNTLALNTNNSWRPTERTSVQFNANYGSSEFIRQNSFDPRELNRTVDSRAGLNHRFDWGTLNLSASRRQQINRNQVDLTLPSASLSLMPITLFASSGGQTRWYNDATLSGNMSMTSRQRDVDDLMPDLSQRNTGHLEARASTGLQIGGFNLSQRVNFSEDVKHAKPETFDPQTDSILSGLPRHIGQQMSWSTSLGYTQRLMGTSTFTPSVQWSGGARRPDTLGVMVHQPARLSTSARLNTQMYGFWPGVGPFSAFRHRIDPSLSYSFSPEQKATPLQEEVFGTGVREVNRLELSVAQTWEAKYEESDTASLDTTSTETASSGEPQRLPQARKVMLLSINTSAVVYDFARRKEGDYGLTTQQLTHNLRSDLLRGFSLAIGHDLFRTDGVGSEAPRRFSPELRSVRANFSVSSDSWLFRALGIGSEADDTTAAEEGDELGPDDESESGLTNRSPGSILGGSGSRTGVGGGQPVGTWRASLNYSLRRPPTGTGNQVLGGTVSFQPTSHWSVDWQTTYNITDGSFSDHVLTLTRDLHRWQASFNFVKAQNGNFAFHFELSLRDNPDIRVPYRHHGNEPGAAPIH